LHISISTFHSPCTSTLKMEVAWSSEMLVSNHHTTQSKNPENQKFYFHHSENLNLTLKKKATNNSQGLYRSKSRLLF
jgi:hypothetical protein